MRKCIQPPKRLLFRYKFWQIAILFLVGTSCLPIIPVRSVDAAGGSVRKAWAPLHECYVMLFLDPGPPVFAVVMLHLMVGLTLSCIVARVIWRPKAAA